MKTAIVALLIAGGTSMAQDYEYDQRVRTAYRDAEYRSPIQFQVELYFEEKRAREHYEILQQMRKDREQRQEMYMNSR